MHMNVLRWRSEILQTFHHNEKKVAKQIKMSADLGCEKAILKYVEFLETGFGVERNLEEAKRYRGMIINNDE